ncbi:hypothetical protein D3C84_1041300 [compost metagenome]
MGEVGHGVGNLHVQPGTDGTHDRHLSAALEFAVVPDAGQGHDPTRLRGHDPGVGKHLLPGDGATDAALGRQYQWTTADHAQRQQGAHYERPEHA